MVNFPAGIRDSNSHTPTYFDLFISSDASICSTMAVSVSIDFPSNLKQNATFHRIAYDYSCVDWDSLCDHLRDVPWEDIFRLVRLLLLVNFVSGSRLEMMYISLSDQPLIISMVSSCLCCCHSS